MQGNTSFFFFLSKTLAGRHVWSRNLPNGIIFACLIVTEVMKPARGCLVCVTLGQARRTTASFQEENKA